MSITIDGTEITGATIDNTDIQEITIDGVSVWVAGPSTPPHGDLQAGYYGTVASGDFISGDSLASDIGLTAGTSYNSTCDWLKFAWNGVVEMVPQKPFRYAISWDNINAIDAVYGGSNAPVVNINGDDYKVRLFRQAGQDPVNPSTESEVIGAENEWNHLMLPIHVNAPDSWGSPEYVDEPTEDWGIDFTDEDLFTDTLYGDGGYQWGQETDSTDSAFRVRRGGYGVSHLSATGSDVALDYNGWRPVLVKQ